jgi:hypothetical protein
MEGMGKTQSQSGRFGGEINFFSLRGYEPRIVQNGFLTFSSCSAKFYNLSWAVNCLQQSLLKS